MAWSWSSELSLCFRKRCGVYSETWTLYYSTCPRVFVEEIAVFFYCLINCSPFLLIYVTFTCSSLIPTVIFCDIKCIIWMVFFLVSLPCFIKWIIEGHANAARLLWNEGFLSFVHFRVIEQLGGKQLVMNHMHHEDQLVRYNALLCVQKLMVHNWYDLFFFFTFLRVKIEKISI